MNSMKGKAQATINFLKNSWDHFNDCNAKDMGAALSYFTIFSLVPLLTILILILGLAFGEEKVQADILLGLTSLAGEDVGNFLEKTLIKEDEGGFNIVKSLLTGSLLLFGVTIITTQLQASFDRIFGYTAQNIPFLKSVRERISSFSIVLILATFMLVFMVLSTGISAFIPYVKGITYGVGIAYIINFFLSFLFIFGFAAINFRYLPHVRLSWRAVGIGALITSILFIIAKLGISLYLAVSDTGSSFGAAGTILIILVWIYFSSQILFFGASAAYVEEMKRINNK
jgi:membrane protein